MNIMHLKYAVEIAKTGSITLAADNLFMNQPNLSKAIKELELTIGTNIFKRTPKGMIPTKKGEEFLKYAKKILAQIEDMEALFISDNKKAITFSASVPRASYIAHAFTQFVSKLDEDKEWEMNFKETNNMETIREVVEGESHLGIIRYDINYERYFMDILKSKRLQYEAIWEYEYMVLMSKNGLLAAKDNLTFHDLDEGIEIIHGDVTVPHLSISEMKKMEQHKKHQIYVYERGSQVDLLNQISNSYMWVSPLPEHTLQRYGLIQKNVKTSDKIFKDVLIYLNGYQLSKIDKEFIQEINYVKNGMINNMEN